MKCWKLNALSLALGLFSTISLCSISGTETGATKESPLDATPSSMPGQSCTHFAPPAQGCHLGSPESYQNCLELQASHSLRGLRSQGWLPVAQSLKEKSDVVFVIRGYGGTAIFELTEDKDQRKPWRDFRNKHLKKVIMAALSEETLGNIKTFAVIDEGIDERTTDTVESEVAGSDKTDGGAYLEGFQLDPAKVNPDSKQFVVIFNSVDNDHLYNHHGQGNITFTDGTTKSAVYLSVSAYSFMERRSFVFLRQTWEERLDFARESYMEEAGGMNGVITQEILRGLGIKAETRGLIDNITPHAFTNGAEIAAENLYGEFSVMRRDSYARREVGRLLEPDTLTMANRILWFKQFGFSGSMITNEPQALCDSDNATNPDARYILDLGDEQFMELNKGRCIKYKIDLPYLGQTEVTEEPVDPQQCIDNNVPEYGWVTLDEHTSLHNGQECTLVTWPKPVYATLAQAVPTSDTTIRLLPLSSGEDHTLCSIIKGESTSGVTLP